MLVLVRRRGQGRYLRAAQPLLFCLELGDHGVPEQAQLLTAIPVPLR